MAVFASTGGGVGAAMMYDGLGGSMTDGTDTAAIRCSVKTGVIAAIRQGSDAVGAADDIGTYHPQFAAQVGIKGVARYTGIVQ